MYLQPKLNNASKMIVLGAKSVGKTALVLRCLTGHFFPQVNSDVDTAYHFEFGGKVMDIVDSKGKNEALISYADGIVLVYSITDRSSFLYLQTVLNKVKRVNFNTDRKIIIVGTKNDKTKQRAVSLYEGQELAVDNHCLFTETSAYSPKQDIHDIFSQLLVKNHTKQATLRKKRRFSTNDYDAIFLTPPTSPSKKTHNLYGSIRNFVQKKRRQSTTEYNTRKYSKPLNRELSKSLDVF